PPPPRNDAGSAASSRHDGPLGPRYLWNDGSPSGLLERQLDGDGCRWGVLRPESPGIQGPHSPLLRIRSGARPDAHAHATQYATQPQPRADSSDGPDRHCPVRGPRNGCRDRGPWGPSISKPWASVGRARVVSHAVV